MVQALWRQYGPQVFKDPSYPQVPDAQAVPVSPTNPLRVAVIITASSAGDLYFGWQPNISNDQNPTAPYGHRIPAGSIVTLSGLGPSERTLYLRGQAGTGQVPISVTEIWLVSLTPNGS